MGNSFCVAAPNDVVVATITTTHPSPNTIVIAVGINNNNNNNSSNDICPSPLPCCPTPLDPEAREELHQQQQQSQSQSSGDEGVHKSLRSTSLATTTSLCTPLSINSGGGGGGGGGGSARRSNRKEREVSVSFLSDTVILHSPHSQGRGQQLTAGTTPHVSSCFATVLEQEQLQQQQHRRSTTTTGSIEEEEAEDRSNTECSDDVLRSMTPLSLPDANAAIAAAATNAALSGTLSPEGEPFQHASSRTPAAAAAADCQTHALSASVSPSLNLSLRSCTSSSGGSSLLARVSTSPSISASSVVAHLYHERDLMLVTSGEAMVAPLVDTESQEYFGAVRSGRETDDENGKNDPSHDNTTTMDREEVTSDNDGGRDMESSQIFENVDEDAPCRDAQLQLRIKVSSNSSTPPAKERRPPSPQVAVAPPPLAEFLSPVSPSTHPTSQQLQLLSPRLLQQRSDAFRKSRAVRHRVIRRQRRRRGGEDVDTTALDDLPEYADDKDFDDDPLSRSEEDDDVASSPPACVSFSADKEKESSSSSSNSPPKSVSGVYYFSSSSSCSREDKTIPVDHEDEEPAESRHLWQQQQQQQSVSESSPPELSLGHVF